MALQIYSAHTGAIHYADRRGFDTIQDLKLWIEQNVGLIQPAQIIMSGRGTAVKASALGNEKEVFVYDRRLLEQGVMPRHEAAPPITKLPPPPADLQNERDLSAWINLFERRAIWAENAFAEAKRIKAGIDVAISAVKIMERAVQVAYTNSVNSSASSRKSLARYSEWAEKTIGELNQKLTEWEQPYRVMGKIPVHDSIASAIKKGPTPPRKLQDLFSYQELREASKSAESYVQQSKMRIDETGKLMEELAVQTEDLGREIQRSRYIIAWEYDESTSSVSNSNASQTPAEEEPTLLLGDTETISKQIRQEYERVRLSKPGTSLLQIQQWARRSTTEFLPTMAKLVEELNRHHQDSIRQKNNYSEATARFLQGIASIQQQSLPFTEKLSKLSAEFDEDVESLRLLTSVSRFPALYGALLVECVRRREWNERVFADSRKIAEEFSLLKSDEEKKRKSWQKSTGELLPFSVFEEAGQISVDLNVQTGFGQSWPNIKREDVEDYINTLRGLEGMDQAIQDVQRAFADLDKAGRRHTRRTNAFKMGSVHEAQLAASSIFQSDEAVRTLRDDNARLSDQLKTYQSRVRKLEDLLHRNYNNRASPHPISVPGTPLSSNPSQNPMGPLPTPSTTAEPPSRPGSVASRRISFIDAGGERVLAARVAHLELELTGERQRLATERDNTIRLERDLAEQVRQQEELKSRIAEAEGMKRDLIGNLEAQQSEFNTERSLLNTKIEELNVKLEAAYEYLDNADESRNEAIERTQASEERIRQLEEELRREQQRSEEILKASEDTKRQYEDRLIAKDRQMEDLLQQIKKWQDEAQKQSDMAYKYSDAVDHERKMRQQTEERLAETQKALSSHLGDKSSIYVALQRLHSELSDDPAPEDVGLLSKKVQQLIAQSNRDREQSAKRLKETEANLDELSKELSKLKNRLDTRTIRAKDVTQRLYTHNARSIQLLEALGFSVVRRENSIQIVRISRSSAAESTTLSRTDSGLRQSAFASPTNPTSNDDINLLYWMDADDSDGEVEKYNKYLSNIGALDLDSFTEAIVKRLKDIEHTARKYQRDMRAYREKYHRAQADAHEKIAYKSFKAGDLVLFLPTRSQVSRPWAAFNVGAPHYFLREQESHKLRNREWLLARVTNVEERVVDLSRPATSASSSTISTINDNPFGLQDGLRWYFLDATEEKIGAPATPGLGNSTVASAKVDAKASLPVKSRTPAAGARKTLTELREGEQRRRSGSMSTRNSVNLQPEDVASITATLGSTPSSSSNVPFNSAQVSSQPPPTPSTPKLAGAFNAVEKIVGFVRGHDDSKKNNDLAG